MPELTAGEEWELEREHSREKDQHICLEGREHDI